MISAHTRGATELWANLSKSVVLQIQAIAFDYDVRATFQRMRGTEISTAVLLVSPQATKLQLITRQTVPKGLYGTENQ